MPANAWCFQFSKHDISAQLQVLFTIPLQRLYLIRLVRVLSRDQQHYLIVFHLLTASLTSLHKLTVFSCCDMVGSLPLLGRDQLQSPPWLTSHCLIKNKKFNKYWNKCSASDSQKQVLLVTWVDIRFWVFGICAANKTCMQQMLSKLTLHIVEHLSWEMIGAKKAQKYTYEWVAFSKLFGAICENKLVLPEAYWQRGNYPNSTPAHTLHHDVWLPPSPNQSMDGNLRQICAADWHRGKLTAILLPYRH